MNKTKTASVIGYKFDLKTLILISPGKSSEKKYIQRQLELLERMGILTMNQGPYKGQSANIEFSFRSEIMLEVCQIISSPLLHLSF